MFTPKLLQPKRQLEYIFFFRVVVVFTKILMYCDAIIFILSKYVTILALTTRIANLGSLHNNNSNMTLISVS